MAAETLSVLLLLKADQYKREARDAATATGQIGKSAATATGQVKTGMAGAATEAKKFGSAWSQTGSLIKTAGITAGVLAVVDGLKSAVTAAEEAASIMRVTEQVIATTGGAANVTAQDVEDMAAQLSSLTGVEDDVIQQGSNVILTFKNIKNEVGQGNDVFDRANELMLDVSAVMGTDLNSAALQLGKALNDPIKGMGALSRAGLQLTADQRAMVTQFVKNGDLLSAQKIILDELETQVGGTAAASATASDRMGAAFGEIAEAIGGDLLPLIEDTADGLAILAGMSPQIEDLGDLIKEMEEVNLSDSFVVGEVTGLVDWRDTMETMIDTADLTGAELVELRNHFEGLRAEGEISAGRFEIVADVIDDRLVPGLEESIGAANRHRGATKEMNTVQEEAVEVFEGTELAVQDAKDALEAYDTAFRRLTDPFFRHLDDQARLQDAYTAYNDVMADAKSSTQDQEAALFDLLEAQQEVNSSGAALPDTMARSEAAFEQLADQLGLTEEQALLMRDVLESIDGQEYRADITAFFKVGGNLNAYDAIVNGSGVQVGNAVFRAAGGPVSANAPYVVGEKGPELFIPNQSGMIIPNNQVAQGAPAGGTVVNNHFVLSYDDFLRETHKAGVDISRLGWT